MGKSEIVLIDTSSWIEALRAEGRGDVRKNVKDLMTEGRAAWCDMVAIELWNGAKGDYEKQKLSELEKEITCLQTNQAVWLRARLLAKACRKAGRTVPAADLIITACALFYNAGIEHCDSHIDSILKVQAAGKMKQ